MLAIKGGTLATAMSLKFADGDTHLIVDKHFADFPLYLAGNFGHTSGVCLCGVWHRTKNAGNVRGMAVSIVICGSTKKSQSGVCCRHA